MDKKMLMNFIDENPITMAFVITAISQYAEQTIQHKEELRKEMKYHIISPELWIEIAEVWQKMLKGN